MVEIRAFKGIRYNRAIIEDISNVLCPPYDIITKEEAEVLQRRSPYNVVRLELPQHQPEDAGENDRYLRSAHIYRQWLAEHVLTRQDAPAMYLVDEEFSNKGRVLRRRGLITTVRLAEFEKGIVMPHEHTRPAPKADRLALMKAAQANFSPIMSLYRDKTGVVADSLDGVSKRQPDFHAQLEGHASYTAWEITDSSVLSRLVRAALPLQLFIADGHHRYETGLQYHNEVEADKGTLSSDAAARYIMMTLFSIDDPGLVVLPYHRLVHGLNADNMHALKEGFREAFDLEEIAVHGGNDIKIAKELEKRLSLVPIDVMAVAAYGLESSRVHLLTLKPEHRPSPSLPPLEQCEYRILHMKVISPSLGPDTEMKSLSFVHDSTQAIASVMSGRDQIAILLRQVPQKLFEAVVGMGERMPAKSTYFYPKLATGLVINSLED